ncbi:5'-nucleotidase C-terminal domain-containing protein [Vibrio lentus]|nr:5'-nucleotidase C-terminal domain-containing protein [Vibrio lentus]
MTASTTLIMPLHAVSYRESNIGNLVADLMKDAGQADIAMISSGSLMLT